MEDMLNSNGVSNDNIIPTSTPQQLATDQFNNNTENPEDLDSRWLRWKCLKCGYLYEGIRELKKCPKCGNDNPDLFEDAD
jgi:rubrerythrin